jgi:hypothetical protein
MTLMNDEIISETATQAVEVIKVKRAKKEKVLKALVVISKALDGSYSVELRNTDRNETIAGIPSLKEAQVASKTFGVSVRYEGDAQFEYARPIYNRNVKLRDAGKPFHQAVITKYEGVFGIV